MRAGLAQDEKIPYVESFATSNESEGKVIEAAAVGRARLD